MENETNQGAMTGDSPFPDTTQPDTTHDGAGEKMVPITQFNSAIADERDRRKLLQQEVDVLRTGMSQMQESINRNSRVQERPSFSVPEEYATLHKDYMDPYRQNVLDPAFAEMRQQINNSVGAVADQLDDIKTRMENPNYAAKSAEVESFRKEHYTKTGNILSRNMAYNVLVGREYATGNGNGNTGGRVNGGVPENMGGETGNVVSTRRGTSPKSKQASDMSEKEMESYLIQQGGF